MEKASPVGARERDRPYWLPWSVFPFQTRFAQVAGKPIHYLDEGSGPALLLVSAGQWSFIFRDMIVCLRGQFRCLTLDFPGCGLSPDIPGHDHGVQANAQILDGLIDALDLQDITMAVHDVGGAARFPGRRQAAGAVPRAGDQQYLRLAAGRLPGGPADAESHRQPGRSA